MNSSDKMVKGLQFVNLQLNRVILPKIKEEQTQEYVTNGKNNSFYQYLIDAKNGSPTHSAIITSYVDLILGNGFYLKEGNLEEFIKFKEMFSEDEVRKMILDFVMFGDANMDIVNKRASKSNLPKVYHLPVHNTAPEKLKKGNNKIERYFYSEDFKKAKNDKKLITEYKVLNQDNKESKEPLCMPIKGYSLKNKYFSDPDYLSGVIYAQIEEEISIFNLSYIKQGMSTGFIVNIPNAQNYTDEKKEELERKIKAKMTGAENAGDIILNFFEGDNSQINIELINSNQSHKQWEVLSKECRQQLFIAHKVVSPMLFGVKENTGLGNNADEMDKAEAQQMKRVIRPKQNAILRVINHVAFTYGVKCMVGFKPLTEEKEEKKKEKQAEVEKMALAEQKALDNVADDLIALGEDEKTAFSDYDPVDIRGVLKETLNEIGLNNIIHFASAVSSSPSKKSEQDTSLFKIRYRYAGNPNPQREFCQKMMKAGKIYRKEDIDKASEMVVNQGFGKQGADTYDIFKYKGGVNCKHFWERVIYLRKNNKRITVNQARKLILELDPKERKGAKFETNPKEVAQIASPSNNYWRA